MACFLSSSATSNTMKRNRSRFFMPFSGGKAHALLCLCISALPSLGTAGPLKQIPLDNYVIQSVPVATVKGNTVIMFPSAIQALYASRCALQEQPNADFLLDFQAGQKWARLLGRKEIRDRIFPHCFERKVYRLQVSSGQVQLYAAWNFPDENNAGSL